MCIWYIRHPTNFSSNHIKQLCMCIFTRFIVSKLTIYNCFQDNLYKSTPLWLFLHTIVVGIQCILSWTRTNNDSRNFGGQCKYVTRLPLCPLGMCVFPCLSFIKKWCTYIACCFLLYLFKALPTRESCYHWLSEKPMLCMFLYKKRTEHKKRSCCLIV